MLLFVSLRVVILNLFSRIFNPPYLPIHAMLLKFTKLDIVWLKKILFFCYPPSPRFKLRIMFDT